MDWKRWRLLSKQIFDAHVSILGGNIEYLDAETTLKQLVSKAIQSRHELDQWKARAEAAEQKNAELAQILECDRTTLSDTLKEIKAIRDGYFWITEGRGNYKWNDDRYRQEFGDAVRAMNKALKPLEKLAADFAGCPATTAEVIEARSPLKKIAELEQRCAELAAALEAARREIFAYGDKNEITNHPWWAIVRNGSFGRMVVLVGPFFSREAAETHRQARLYEYGEKSYVYCYSGNRSQQYKALREALKRDPAAILAARDEAMRKQGAVAILQHAANFCERRARDIDGNLSADLSDIEKWIAAVESGELKPWEKKV